MTVVVNLFGPPCSGKSTTAAGLYYNLKIKHQHCEMVREYIKSWAWDGRKPGQYDQVYLFGKQAKYESSLYNKVDYLVTDSPILLSGFYDQFHNGEYSVRNAAIEFMHKAQENGVVYKNFWLPSHDRFDERGRNHSPEEVGRIEDEMLSWLFGTGFDFTSLNSVPLENRVDEILKLLKVVYP